MSEINQHNYEAFYLDYLEGNLSAEATAQLLLFLEKNPTLKLESDEFDLIQLNTTKEIKFDKETLKQNINKDNVEDFIITSIENLIEPEDAIELADYIKNSQEATALAERYEKTILPIKKISFPGKNNLKKKAAVVHYIAPLVSAAAVVLILFLLNPPSTDNKDLLIGLHQLNNKETNSFNSELSVKEKVIGIGETDSLIKNDKETEFVFTTEQQEFKKITAVIDKDSLLNSDTPHKETRKNLIHNESLVGENRELVQFKKIKPMTIYSVGNDSQQILAIIDRTKIKTEIDKNTTSKVIENQINTNPEFPERRRRINLFKIAEIGLKGFNKLNERDFALKPNYTNSGQLKSVTLETEKRRITAPAI